MNSKSKSLKSLLALGLCVVSAILVVWAPAAEKGSQQQQPSIKVLNFPEGTLELREKQLLVRKHAAGWQVCRVRRFVWQDSLVVLQSPEKVVGLIREADTADSRPMSDNNGLFVVFQVATRIFATLGQVKIDESLLKSMAESDEILVKAAGVKPPSFSLVK